VNASAEKISRKTPSAVAPSSTVPAGAKAWRTVRAAAPVRSSFSMNRSAKSSPSGCGTTAA
jgi:hypothetical protein